MKQLSTFVLTMMVVIILAESSSATDRKTVLIGSFIDKKCAERQLKQSSVRQDSAALLKECAVTGIGPKMALFADGYLYALDKQGRKLADSAILSAGKDTTMPFRVSGRVSVSRRHAYISAPEGINLAIPYGALRRKIKVQTIEKADQQIFSIPKLNAQQNQN